MLLPSVLPCDGRVPQQSPLRRSSRQSLPSYRTAPPFDDAPSAASGLFQTCKRLHQILSVDGRALTPTPPPSSSSSPEKKLREIPQPSTPSLRRGRRGGAVRTPVNKNKRCRDVAFDHESEQMEKEVLRDPFSTPKNKRVKMTAAPSPPNRNLRVERPVEGLGYGLQEMEEEEEEEWTVDEDRRLVELVLQRMRLSRDDWEECARSLSVGLGDGRKSGRNGKSLGRRWESLVAGRDVGLRDRRRLLKPKPRSRVGNVKTLRK